LENYNKSETTLRDLLRVVFRHKLVFMLVFIVIMVSVYIGMELRTPLYQARVMILVAGKMQKDIEVERELGPGSIVQTQMVLVRSTPIIRRAVEALKLYQRPLDYEKRYTTKLNAYFIEHAARAEELEMEGMTNKQREAYLFSRAMNDLAGNIEVQEMAQDSSMFSIAVTDYDPVTAAIIANVVSRSYVIFDIEQQIAGLQLTYGEKNSTIVRLEYYIDKLKESLDGRPLSDIEALGPASVKIVGQAGGGMMIPMKPGKTTALVIGFLMSVILGVALSYLFDYFDQTFRSPKDIETFLNIRYLGSVPRRRLEDKPIISRSNTKNTNYSQSFQNVSENIYLLMKDNKLNSFIITDSEGSRETVSVIANIGIYLAHKADIRVLIIDVNPRMISAGIASVFNVADIPGLTDVLEGQANFEDVVLSIGPNLSVLPAGRPMVNPIKLLESSMLSDLIKQTKSKYDVVLINCADIKNYTDAAILSSFTDGVVLVINEGQIRRQIVGNAIVPLKEKGTNIIGGILTNRTHAIPGIIYKLT